MRRKFGVMRGTRDLRFARVVQLAAAVIAVTVGAVAIEVSSTLVGLGALAIALFLGYVLTASTRRKGDL
jgi:hypothetical protein